MKHAATERVKEYRMKIVVIDGQGGRIGALVCEELKRTLPTREILAIGTNSSATAAMIKAGADRGATGENPVVVAARDADVIIGPIGILSADALLGEVTPAMAVAIGQSRAEKLLLPVNRCSTQVVGVRPLPIHEMIGELSALVAAIEADTEKRA